MKFIAHRGNINGVNSTNHNVAKIWDAIEDGFYVELDLWCIKNNYYLGHDKPEIQIQLTDFDHPQVFFHLKNLFLPKLKFADAFAINNDDYVFTLRDKLWCNYKVGYSNDSIICAPELVGSTDNLDAFIKDNMGAFGVCTDYGMKVRNILSSLV